jgi:hypothetical protein
MKNLMTFGLVVFMGAVALAENPDKRASIGMDLTQSAVGVTTGLQSFYDSSDNTTTYTHEHSTLNLTQVIFDLRAPVSNDVTFTVHGGPQRAQMFGASDNGYSIGAGLRVYLPESFTK